VGLHSIWRAATAEHRRWIFWNAIVIAAVVNGVLSALIAWGSAASEDEIPLWAAPLVGGPSTVVDSVATFFVLTFLTTIIITTVVRAEMRHERMAPIPEARALAESLPRGRVKRGALLGLICMAVLGPIAALVLVAIDYDHLSVGDFVLYKAVFGIVLGLVVTPPIALAAMGDAEDERAEMARPGIEPGTP
jgi:hypothetical protein